MGRLAALSQEAGLVPIVEPDVMMSGPHTLEDSRRASEAIWLATYQALSEQLVDLESTLIKTNMIISGTDCANRAGVEEVSAATVASLRRCIPAAVPGVVFLSGGQSDVEATHHLSLMNRLGPQPWELSFSYARAIQQPVIAAWAGDPANSATAQTVFRHRARMNAAARDGSYSPAMEAELAT